MGSPVTDDIKKRYYGWSITDDMMVFFLSQ